LSRIPTTSTAQVTNGQRWKPLLHIKVVSIRHNLVLNLFFLNRPKNIIKKKS